MQAQGAAWPIHQMNSEESSLPADTIPPGSAATWEKTHTEDRDRTTT